MQCSYIKFDHIFAYKWPSFGSISAIFILPYNQKSQKHFLSSYTNHCNSGRNYDLAGIIVHHTYYTCIVTKTIHVWLLKMYVWHTCEKINHTIHVWPTIQYMFL